MVPRRRRVRAAGRRRSTRALHRVRARELRLRRRPQVALPAEGVRDPAGARAGGPRGVVRARAGVPAAPAARAARDGDDVRVLETLPCAQVLARDAGARGGGVRRGDRTQPGAGSAPVPDGLGQGRLRGARAAEAVDRGVPSRAGRGRGRRLPQPSAGPGDPGRRARVDVERADRRRGLASPVLRELPNHRGGRARRRRDRGRDRRAPRPRVERRSPVYTARARAHRPERTGGNRTR